MGGRGGSSGLSGGGASTIKQLGIPKNELQGISFDASKFQGSAAQIKYAQDIIDRGYSYADNQIKYDMESLESFYKRIGSNPSKYEIEALADAAANVKSLVEGKKFLKKSLDKATKASGIIRNKSQVEGLFPSVRDNSKEKYRKEYLEKYKKMFKK